MHPRRDGRQYLADLIGVARSLRDDDVERGAEPLTHHRGEDSARHVPAGERRQGHLGDLVEPDDGHPLPRLAQPSAEQSGHGALARGDRADDEHEGQPGVVVVLAGHGCDPRTQAGIEGG